jgi:hypothetical protein
VFAAAGGGHGGGCGGGRLDDRKVVQPNDANVVVNLRASRVRNGAPTQRA